MRYIENEDFREWVQERLQRKLVQQAHELAVQTGCEVLLRLQEADQRHHSKYYVSDGLKYDYENHGFRLSPGDQPMSGESGLPKKYVNDFTCQVMGDSDNSLPNGADMVTPIETGMMLPSQHHQNGELEVTSDEQWRRLYSEKVYVQQTSAAAAAALRMNTALQRAPGWRWPLPDGLPQHVSPAGSSTTDTVPNVQMNTHSTHNNIEGDDVLSKLKHLHCRTFSGSGRGRDFQESSISGRLPTCKATDAVHHRDHFNVLPTPHSNRRPIGPEDQDLPTVLGAVVWRPGSHTSLDAETVPQVNNTEQKYLCRICERTFCDLYLLVSHARTFHSHKTELVFLCNSCKGLFHDATSLQEHLNTHGHIGFLQGATCQINGYSTNELPHRRVHVRRFPCPECGRQFSRFGFMQSHIDRVHGGTRLSTPIDMTALTHDPTKDSTVPTENTVNVEAASNNDDPNPDMNHSETTSSEVYKCRQCDEVFNEMNLLRRHVNEKHIMFENKHTVGFGAPVQCARSKSEDLSSSKTEIFQCQECGEQFTRGKLLQNHVNNCHIPGSVGISSPQQDNENTDNWSCDQPAKTSELNSVSAISKGHEHVIINSSEIKREVTDEGDKPAKDSILRESHLSVPEESNVRIFGYQSHISKQTSHATISVNGVLMDQDERQLVDTNNTQAARSRRKRFACDVCGKTYKYGFHMKEHRLTHAAVCPFVCHICNMGFFRQRQLRDHELRHSGAYPCRCEVCGKGFPRTSELKRHLAFRHRRFDVYSTTTQQGVATSSPEDGHTQCAS